MSTTGERAKKMRYLDATEFSPAIKKKEVMPFAATWMDPETITK